MSFWNFLGEFALFNLIREWFSGKPKSRPQPYPQLHNHIHDMEYENRIEELQREIEHSQTMIAEHQQSLDDDLTYGIDNYDADDLQDHIDKLEEQLDNCDVMSDRYDSIRDELDRLKDKLDDIECRQDMYDDMQDELDEMDDLDEMNYMDDMDYQYDDPHEIYMDHDDDW